MEGGADVVGEGAGVGEAGEAGEVDEAVGVLDAGTIRTCIGHEHPLHMRMPIRARRGFLSIETLDRPIPIQHPIPLYRRILSAPVTLHYH